MQINLSPARSDLSLTLSKQGDSLVVNGEAFDFSALPDGATLPADAIDSEFFVGPVERIAGELRLTLLLPVGPNPSQEAAFPSPINAVNDGPVELPQ